MMNNSAKNTSKAIALFLSLGLMSSLIGCEADGGGDAPAEQPAPEQEGGEGGEQEDGEEGGEQEDGEEGGEQEDGEGGEQEGGEGGEG